MDNANIQQTGELIDFIRACPTSFQTVQNIVSVLEKEGFSPLPCAEEKITHGKYYITQNQSAVIALDIPSDADSFMITASHSDSPSFKLKDACESVSCGKYLRLNTEKYGGMIISSWLDRPLSLAGRVVINENGRIISKPVVIDRDLVLIPNVAIHFNRSVNDGYSYNPAVDTLPLISTAENKGTVRRILAEAAKTEENKIVGADIFLYNRTAASIWGSENEFFSAPRIDNLMCAYSTLCGFVRQNTHPKSVSVYAVFDNEETGSGTKQGAASVLLSDTLRRVSNALGRDYQDMLRSSFMVSADNGHACHPNHPELSDAQNAPYMNGGVVIKTNANQKYTTDGVSRAVFSHICAKAGVPVQNFANRSDIPGGSTLGSIANTNVPVNTVDIGLAQLAMHSCYETAGCSDTGYMIRAIKAFYATHLKCGSDYEISVE